MSNYEFGRDEGAKLYIGRLNGNISEEALKNIMGTYGPTKSVRLHSSGNFGFVEYFEVSHALEAMHNVPKFDKMNLIVKPAKEKVHADPNIYGEGKPFNMMETPVAPPPVGNQKRLRKNVPPIINDTTSGMRCVDKSPVFLAPARDLVPTGSEARSCFCCNRSTVNKCRTCNTAFCNYECLRNTAELHASFCQRLIFNDAEIGSSVGAIVSQSGDCNADAQPLTGKPSGSVGNGDLKSIIEGSRFKLKVAPPHATHAASLSFSTRFKVNAKSPSTEIATLSHRQPRNSISRSDRNQRDDESKYNSSESLIRQQVKRDSVATVKSPIKTKISDESPRLKPTPPRLSDNPQIAKHTSKAANIKETPIPRRPFIVTVMYSENNGHWVLPEFNRSEYNRVSNVLESRDMKSMPSVHQPTLGDLCAAEYEDAWYRAKVTRVTPLQIHFIDYGNSEKWTSDLKTLPTEIAQVEPLVFFMIFKGHEPQNLTYKDVRIRCVSCQGGTKVVVLDGEPASSEPLANPSNDVPNAAKMITGTCPNLGGNSPVQPVEDRFPPNTSVEVQYVISSCEVTVMRYDEVDKYTLLANDVAEVCAQGKPLTSKPPVNALVGALFKCDKTFYRAQILKYEEDKIHVHFVDYGNKDIVELCELRALPNHITMEPPAALAVKLLNVPLVTAAEAVPAVCNLISDVPYQMVYKGKISDGVELISDGSNLNKKIITELGPKPDNQVHIPTVFSQKQMAILALEEGQQKLLILWNGDLDAKGVLYCARTENRVVSHVIHGLQDNLNEYCSNIDVKAYCPHIGEVCAVLHQSGDGAEWYRAIAVMSVGETRTSVYYCDFGNTEEVDNAHIRPIGPEFLETPAIANQCIIKGYPSNVDDKRKAHILQVTQEGNFITGHVQHHGDYFELAIPEIDAILQERSGEISP